MIKSHRDPVSFLRPEVFVPYYTLLWLNAHAGEVTPGVFEKLDPRRPLLDVCDEPKRRCPVLVIYSVLI